MRHFDLSPLYRSTVGFDRFVTLLDSIAGNESETQGYPPYNIERLGEDKYRITMAIAGFGENDLNIEVKEGMLSIHGEKADEKKDGQYLHRGIAARTFERRFRLADYVEVNGATIENGMLHVDLVREVPEKMKPRTIAIGLGDKPSIVDHSAASA